MTETEILEDLGHRQADEYPLGISVGTLDQVASIFKGRRVKFHKVSIHIYI